MNADWSPQASRHRSNNALRANNAIPTEIKIYRTPATYICRAQLHRRPRSPYISDTPSSVLKGSWIRVAKQGQRETLSSNCVIVANPRERLPTLWLSLHTIPAKQTSHPARSGKSGLGFCVRQPAPASFGTRSVVYVSRAIAKRSVRHSIVS